MLTNESHSFYTCCFYLFLSDLSLMHQLFFSSQGLTTACFTPMFRLDAKAVPTDGDTSKDVEMTEGFEMGFPQQHTKKTNKHKKNLGSAAKKQYLSICHPHVTMFIYVCSQQKAAMLPGLQSDQFQVEMLTRNPVRRPTRWRM